MVLLTLLHSEWPKLHRVSAILSTLGYMNFFIYFQLEEELDLPDIPTVNTPPTLESILNEVNYYCCLCFKLFCLSPLSPVSLSVSLSLSLWIVCALAVAISIIAFNYLFVLGKTRNNFVRTCICLYVYITY